MLHTYSLKGADLWQLKKNVPEIMIEKLYELRQKEFFFKQNLLNEVEAKISNPTLFKKYEEKIENQISKIPFPSREIYFLFVLINGVEKLLRALIALHLFKFIINTTINFFQEIQ